MYYAPCGPPSPREHTTTSSSTESLGQALRVSLVKPGAYLSESYDERSSRSIWRTLIRESTPRLQCLNISKYSITVSAVIQRRLLLDSRVVDVPMASNPTFVTLSSVKPFFFNGLQNA